MATSTNYSKAYADLMNERNEINRKATIESLAKGLEGTIAGANANLERQTADYNRAITENQNSYNRGVQNTNDQYQNLINQVQAEKYRSPRLLNERFANLFGGNTTGISRTNALYNNVKYDNQTQNLRQQKQKTLEDLLNQSNLTEQKYRDAIRDLSNTTAANILGYQSDYNNNLARVNAQYDANILPWYEEEVPQGGYYSGYSYGSNNSISGTPGYNYTAGDTSDQGLANAKRYIDTGALRDQKVDKILQQLIDNSDYEKRKKGIEITRGGIVRDDDYDRPSRLIR